MSESERIEGHSLGDPDEALEYFTPERMEAATPRAIQLDEDGRRLPRDDSGEDADGAVHADPPGC